MKATDVCVVVDITKECKLSYWSAEAYLEQLGRKNFILDVASINRLVIGFAATRVITCREAERSPENFAPSLEIPDDYGIAEICNIAVKNDFQSRGVGKLLLERVISVCEKNRVAQIWLDVRASNTKAISFYKSRGFRVTGRRGNFYTLPAEDAVLMNLALRVSEADKTE